MKKPTSSRHRKRSTPVVRSEAANDELTVEQIACALNLGELSAYRDYLLRIDKALAGPRALPADAMAEAKTLIADIERKAIELLKEATWLC